VSVYYFIEPTDSLFVRGNLSFGDSGEHGAGVMPPPPSLFAGALRSAILGRDAARLERFQREGRTGDADLDDCLGVLDPGTGSVLEPGSFRMSWLSLAGKPIGGGGVESLHRLPADLACLRRPAGTANGQAQDSAEIDAVEFAPVEPGAPSGLRSGGHPLPLQPILRFARQGKPLAGQYLRRAAWQQHLEGRLTHAEDGQRASAESIYRADPRLGVGLDAHTRTASKGLLYTTEGHAFSPPANGDRDRPFAATGFLVGVEGAADHLGQEGMLRLGGDGRSARYERVTFDPPAIPRERCVTGGRFRLILLTPGIFEQGWIPDGIERSGDSLLLRTSDFSARLVCAALPRHEVVSGWNLLAWAPKPALRSVPAGSVYWFDDFQGDPGKLAAWAASGLACQALEPGRRAEGYNLAQPGCWPQQPVRPT